MDGLEFLLEVRNIDLIAKVPVLILTTETKPELKEVAKELHVAGWIVKPFNPKQLSKLYAECRIR